MVYTVGEMAKLLGVTASTLRYYDKEGLLPFVGRTPGGIRVFDDADLDSLRRHYEGWRAHMARGNTRELLRSMDKWFAAILDDIKGGIQ